MSTIKFKNNGDIPDVVELKGVKQTYGEGKSKKTVIEDLDLLIENEPGENQLIAILGPSGCGKSTLLRYIANLNKPTAGEVLLYGEPISKKNVAGMVFQDYSVFPWRTVLDNVAFGLETSNLKRKEIVERSMEMLKLVGLEAQADQWSTTLSGGQKQRLAIARSLIANPKILLMDEPFGALDVKVRLQMQDLMQSLINDKVSDTAILFVTHDIPEAVYLADEILIMKANPGEFVDRIKITGQLPARRTDALKRENKFVKLVWDIEDRMKKIAEQD